MLKHSRRLHLAEVLSVTIILGVLFSSPFKSYAATTSTDIAGTYYEFDKKNGYVIEDATTTGTTPDHAFGKLSIAGNYTKTGDDFTVKDGELSLAYTFSQEKLSSEDTEWHIIKDSSKKVNNIDLENKINSGTLILQTSLDGKSWCTEMTLTDVLTSETPLQKTFYTTKAIQQQNGCYYQVIVAYELKKKTGTHKVGFVTVDDTETKRVSEVYKFHAIDKDVGEIISADDTPRMELGDKIKTGKDNGFSGEEEIDRDDPHYAWDLGNFTINGYTRKTKKDGNLVFLKNVGDRVVLWFTLKQDIDALNGNSTLSISNDDGAYDEYFEIPRTNFGRGTLIIQYTDYEGVKHDPVIYTNYLAAYSKTGADTRVQLFEEGDYEVSLDYEIKNNPRQVGPVSVVPTYTDYKIAFSFSIRNGNCMVYPFDVVTKNELSDNAITENGFRLDMAKSRYLTINVEKQDIVINADGTISTDTRFNRPAKDNEQYSDEGIYSFTVRNLYTDDKPTPKTIYVGSNKYLRALSRTGMTPEKAIENLNEKILQGDEVQDDGTILKHVEETPQETSAEVPSTTESTAEIPESSTQKETSAAETQQPVTTSQQKTSSSTTQTTKSQTSSDSSDSIEAESEEKNKNSNIPTTIIVIIVILGVLAVYVISKKKPSIKKEDEPSVDKEEPKK